MTLQRMDNVGIVVEDLDAAIAFFTELGMEREGKAQLEGLWADRTVGLDGDRSRSADPTIPRRGPSSIANSTYTVRGMSVSTVKKSNARIAWACDLRNSVQVGPARRGAGPSPFVRRSVRIVVAETRIPSLRSSPRIRRHPHRGFSSHPQDELSNLIGDRRPAAGRRAPVGPLPSHQLLMPPQQCLRADQER